MTPLSTLLENVTLLTSFSPLDTYVKLEWPPGLNKVYTYNLVNLIESQL